MCAGTGGAEGTFCCPLCGLELADHRRKLPARRLRVQSPSARSCTTSPTLSERRFAQGPLTSPPRRAPALRAPGEPQAAVSSVPLAPARASEMHTHARSGPVTMETQQPPSESGSRTTAHEYACHVACATPLLTPAAKGAALFPLPFLPPSQTAPPSPETRGKAAQVARATAILPVASTLTEWLHEPQLAAVPGPRRSPAEVHPSP